MKDRASPIIIEKAVNVELQHVLTSRLKMLKHSQRLVLDSQVPGSYVTYGDPVFDTLLLAMQGRIEEVTNQKLYPTYSYGRLYKMGAHLERHTDRSSCEISLMIPLWSEHGEVENFFFEEPVSRKTHSVQVGIGSMLLFRGCELKHWREPATFEYFNLLLHYVDAFGPNADLRYDERKYLTI